jgi:hypothetical protein
MWCSARLASARAVDAYGVAPLLGAEPTPHAVRLVALERVEKTLGAHEAAEAQRLGGSSDWPRAGKEVDLARVLAAQRIALPGRAVEELEQVLNGRYIGLVSLSART